MLEWALDIIIIINTHMHALIITAYYNNIVNTHVSLCDTCNYYLKKSYNNT